MLTIIMRELELTPQAANAVKQYILEQGYSLEEGISRVQALFEAPAADKTCTIKNVSVFDASLLYGEGACFSMM